MAIERVKWAPDAKMEFLQWMFQELHNALGDRQTLVRKWQDNIVQWRARVIGSGVADVPFVGASDIELPLTAMHVDPVYADFMQTIHLPQDFWSVVGKRPDTVDIADPLQAFLSRFEAAHLKMRQVNIKAFLDLIIHGTCIYKDTIRHEKRKQRSPNDDAVTMALVHQPQIQHVPLEQFIIPAYAYSVDPDAPNGAAPWVAQEFYLTAAQLAARAKGDAPWLPTYDKDATDSVLHWEENIVGQRPVEETRQKEDLFTPWRDWRIILYEIWVRYDVDNDGVEEDIVVIYHHRSRTVLRALVNPFLHGKRPFSAQPYMPGLGFYGLGTCDIDEWAQLASTRILNNLIDATLLSNSIMIGVPQGMNISPDEPIHPYKVWPLAPGERLSAIQMGQPHPGAANLLQMLSQWSEQRSGVNDLRQGDISTLPSRTPAATTMSVLAEGKKRFDMVLGNLRDGPLADLGVRTLQNLVQITKSDPRWVAFAVQTLGEKKAQPVIDVLQGPVQDVDSAFGVSVTATSSQVNKEVQKQALVSLAQLMAQMWPQQLQFAQVMGDKQRGLAVATAAYGGTIELQRRLLEAYDIQNPDQYVAQMPEATPMGVAPSVPPGAQDAAPGAAPGAPGAGAGIPGVPPIAPTPLGGTLSPAPLAQGAPQLGALLGL